MKPSLLVACGLTLVSTRLLRARPPCPRRRPLVRPLFCFTWLLVAVLVSQAFSVASAQGPTTMRPVPGVEVRVYGGPPFSDSTKGRMRSAADGILRAAGVSPRWHDCPAVATDPQCARPAGEGVIIVRFVDGYAVPAATCGEAVHGVHQAAGVVTLYHGCVSDLVQAIRMRSESDAPMLMRVSDGHVFGLMLVHEIGHLLGQAHTAAGIMRPVVTLTEWQDLATGRLFFSSAQGTTLRAAASPTPESQVARTR